MACASDLNQGATNNQVNPFRNFDYFNNTAQSKQVNQNFINKINLYNNSCQCKQINRLLVNEFMVNNNPKQIQYNLVQKVFNYLIYLDNCTDDYKYQKLVFMDRGFDLDKFMKPQPCYVNFYVQNAQQNGLQRLSLKEVKDCAIISYSSHAYYPQIDLVCLSIFSYYNFLLPLNAIFQNSTNFILER
ncbi:hypothetical protein ABPG72_017695 [Tetrahymena utriculariae]